MWPWFFLKRANPIWSHMVNITKNFFHLTQIIMLLDTPHVIIAFGFFFSFCRNWSKLPYNALIDDVEVTCMVPTIDRSNSIRMYKWFPKMLQKTTTISLKFHIYIKEKCASMLTLNKCLFCQTDGDRMQFIHRFQLFTKVQFTKACWTKLPEVVGKKEQIVFGLEIET